MKKNVFQVGATWETLDKDDVMQVMQKHADVLLLREAQGVKYLRFGPVQGSVSGSAVTIGNGSNPIGPRSGYIWSIRRLSVSGLTSGGTPDTIQLYRDNPGGQALWSLDGNNFFAKFGRLELALFGGEQLYAVGTSLQASGPVALDGDVLEVPAVQIYKLT